MVSVVGCRDLRSAQPAASGAPSMQPYVALLLRQGRAAQPLLHETRISAGTSPNFGETARVSMSGKAAVQGVELEAVVFDGAAASGAGAGGIIGVARIRVPPAGHAAAAKGGGAGVELHPLLHPTSGRHAGVLELGVRWE